jgi:hypothetical protein
MDAKNVKWEDTIEPLVKRLKLDSKAVTDKILAAKLVETADENGAEVLMDPDAIDIADFRAAFAEAAKGPLNLAIKEIRAKATPAAKPEAVTAAAVPSGVAAPPIVGTFTIPDVPEGSAFLDALSTSKTLAVDPLSIRAAMEALFVDSRNLTEIPEKLAKLMETHADTIEEPVGSTFLEVLKFVRERRWADVNVDSKLVTKERKKVVLERLRELPHAVYQFHQVLAGWNEQLKANRAGNPLGVLAGGVNAL